MLSHFRKHTKTIVWIVVASFIIWGGYSASTIKKEGRYAGEVFGKPVTFQEYNKFYNATQLFMPAKNKSDLENADVLRAFTWQNIIYAREAQRLGVKVPDEEVRQEIANILVKQGLAAPTQEQYRIWLTRTLRISPREFEEGLREFMRIQRLLRTKLESFQNGSSKTPDTEKKTGEEIDQKKQAAFMLWTNKLNQKAALKDYLALPETAEEEPTPAPTPAPATKK